MAILSFHLLYSMYKAFLSVCLSFSLVSLNAQNFKNASDYTSFLKQLHVTTANDVISFAVELESSNNSKVTEARRRSLSIKLKASLLNVKKQPDYKSDRSLLDSLIRYTQQTQTLFEKEYALLARLQDSASRSYLHERKFASFKQMILSELIQNEKGFVESLKAFAAKYSVAFQKKYTEELDKLVLIQKVGKQHNTYRSVYFKCSSQEALLAKAMDFRKKTEMEQYSSVLIKYVKEGYKVLDTLKVTYVDKNLTQATKELLAFYEQECEYKVPMLISFMSRGGEDQRKGKTDIGNNVNINPHVNIAGNADVATYSNTKGDLDTERPLLVGKWNKASQDFLKKYLPEVE